MQFGAGRGIPAQPFHPEHPFSGKIAPLLVQFRGQFSTQAEKAYTRPGPESLEKGGKCIRSHDARLGTYVPLPLRYTFPNRTRQVRFEESSGPIARIRDEPCCGGFNRSFDGLAPRRWRPRPEKAGPRPISDPHHLYTLSSFQPKAGLLFRAVPPPAFPARHGNQAEAWRSRFRRENMVSAMAVAGRRGIPGSRILAPASR